jgi:hypothetical protein
MLNNWRLLFQNYRRAVTKQTLVGSNADLGIFYLSLAGLAPQLPRQLADLRYSLRWHRFAKTS